MEWHRLGGTCQNGATVICNTQGGFKRGMVFVFLTTGSALFSLQGLRLRPT